MSAIPIWFALQAQAAAPPASGPASSSPFGAGCAGQSGMFMPLLFIVVIFYFMLIRPQQKKQREQQEWLKSLKKGDEVVTSGGLVGRITGLTDQTVTLEVQEKVRLKVLRSHIAGKPPQSGQQAAAEPDKK